MLQPQDYTRDGIFPEHTGTKHFLVQFQLYGANCDLHDCLYAVVLNKICSVTFVMFYSLCRLED